MALEDKKINNDLPVNEALADAVRSKLIDGKLSCSSAFLISLETSASPLEVGRTADLIPVHLTECQLGLFGYPGHTKGWEKAGSAQKPVPEGLEQAIENSKDENNRLTCITAWEIADRFKVSRMLVGYLADRLNFKMHQCQLGAF